MLTHLLKIIWGTSDKATRVLKQKMKTENVIIAKLGESRCRKSSTILCYFSDTAYTRHQQTYHEDKNPTVVAYPLTGQILK